MMSALLILSMVSWSAVVIYMAPAVYSAIMGRPRRGDPARVVCFGFGLLCVGGVSRIMFFPDSDEALAVVVLAGIILAWHTIYAARSYGRGSRA